MKLSLRRCTELVATTCIVVLGPANSSWAQDTSRDITIALTSESPDLDVCMLSEGRNGMISKQNIYETVTQLNPDTGDVEPRIATEWERVDDLSWRFELREGVTYHDGDPLTAENFAESFERTLDPDLSCVTRLLYFEGFDTEISAVGDLTVEIATSSPVPLLPTLMTYVGVGKVPEDYSSMSREPVGTGPYKFASWQPGQSVTLEPYENYWGEIGQVETATYVFREEPAVRAAMVATGEADIANIERIDADNPETDFTYLNSETERLRLDVYKPPLDDVRVRKAINYAIDKEALIGTVYPETYELALNFVMPNINGYNPDVTEYEYNPERARELVEEAASDGVPVDTEIEYHVQNYGGTNLELSTVLTEMINDVGLNVRMILAGDNLGYYKPFPEGQPPNIYNDIHDNNSGDAGLTLVGKYTSEGGSSKLSEPEIDAMVEEALTLENPERREIFEEVFAQVREQAYDVILAHQTEILRVSERLNYTPTSATNTSIELAEITFSE